MRQVILAGQRTFKDDDCKAFLEWRRDRKQEHQTSLHAIVWALSEQGQAEFATEREKLADLIKFRQLQDAAI